MDHFPLNIKISYNQRLDIQLFIRHQLHSQKFKRHWIFCKGFDSLQENKILKTYLSFLNQGDLYKIKTSNFSGKWKEKTYEDIQTIMRKSTDQKHRKYHRIMLQKQLEAVENQVFEKQYDQMIVVTIFLSQTLQMSEIRDFAKVLRNQQNNQLILNIVAPEQFLEKLYLFQTWIRIYSLKEVRDELRGLFSTLNRTSFRKISIALKCLDGDVVINENPHFMGQSCWKMQRESQNQNQFISNTIYFPSCNSPYIMSVEMKNMLKTETCSFQLLMLCEDESGQVSQSTKSFSIKPTKEFLDWTDSLNNMNEFKQIYRYQQMSISFQEVNLYQKLHFMKIVGTPARVMIKNTNRI